MIKQVILAEFFGYNNEYAFEIIESKNNNPEWLDKRYIELINDKKNNPVWSVTLCDMDIAYEISYDGDLFYWTTYKKLFYNKFYRQIFVEEGKNEDFEQAISDVMNAYADLMAKELLTITTMKEEDIDDDFTEIKS